VLHLAGGYRQYKCIYHEIMIMSREERKLDSLKMNSRGATIEAPTGAVRPKDGHSLVRRGGGEQRG